MEDLVLNFLKNYIDIIKNDILSSNKLSTILLKNKSHFIFECYIIYYRTRKEDIWHIKMNPIIFQYSLQSTFPLAKYDNNPSCIYK